MDSNDRGGIRGWRRLVAALRTGPLGVHALRANRLLRTGGPILAVALVLGGFGAAFASQAGRLAPTKALSSAATTTASPSITTTPDDTPSGTVTASATTTASSTATSGADPSTPTPTPIPTAQYFHLLSVSVQADPADNFTHTCNAMVYESFTATLTADANGPSQTISYTWPDIYANGWTYQSGTVTFAPHERTKTITFQEGYNAGRGNGSAQPDSFEVTYPDSWMWASPQYTHTTVAFTCVRQLTSLTLTPSITSWNAPCGTASTPVTFTWTLTASPGPDITAAFGPKTESSPGFATWWAPNSYGEDVPATTGPDQPSTLVSGTFNDALSNNGGSSSNGTYWMQIATTAPTALTARATVVKNC